MLVIWVGYVKDINKAKVVRCDLCAGICVLG